MGKTSIEWATDSWNPITGCTPVTEGCRFCYARRMAKRLAGRCGYPEAPHEFDVTFHPDKLEEPLRWRKRRVVFVCSMSDLFHEDVTDEMLVSIFGVMVRAAEERGHAFLWLTKRPERAVRFMRILNHLITGNPRSPVSDRIYGGVTIEDQDQIWRLDYLSWLPMSKRYVSVEPCLGAVELGDALNWLDGVIVGGESGPGARPMHPDWARSIRDQCVPAGVAYTFKQWGAWKPVTQREVVQSHRRWSDYSYVAQNPADPHNCGTLCAIERHGKKAAGRDLDGIVWDEFPWKLLEAER